mgnify:FL=1
MELDVLTAISPIDGRYRGKTKALAAYFSEFALIKYRVQVEVEYFITLCELPLPQLKGIDNSVFETLRNIYRNFSEADAQRIKDIESVTNHDVKAVEYFLKEEVDKLGGLPENTSPDVSCYVPEHSDQIRVEFVIPCDKGNFKVFINYFPDGSLYNYVIWKNETK